MFASGLTNLLCKYDLYGLFTGCTAKFELSSHVSAPVVHLRCTTLLNYNPHYIPINDISFQLSVFWLSDTESRTNELRLFEFITLSFKTRLMSVTCFCVDGM